MQSMNDKSVWTHHIFRQADERKKWPVFRQADEGTNWRWDKRVGRYRDTVTGRFISKAHVLELLQFSINASNAAVDSLANYIANGMISPSDWMNAFRWEIKSEYIRQYLVGIGGRAQMTPSEWGKLGSLIKEQYQYLKGFAADVAKGEMTEGQIRARMNMYINSSREAYFVARGRVIVKLKLFDEVIWTLGIAEHCPDCIERSEMGWMPITEDGGFPTADGSAFPGDGSTVCLTNCKCQLNYRNSATEEEYEG